MVNWRVRDVIRSGRSDRTGWWPVVRAGWTVNWAHWCVPSSAPGVCTWRSWGVSVPLWRLRRPGDVAKGFTLLKVLWRHHLNGQVLPSGILLFLSPGVVVIPLLHLSPFLFNMTKCISLRAPPLRATGYIAPAILPSHVPHPLTTPQPLHGSAHTVDSVKVPGRRRPAILHLVPPSIGRSCSPS